MIEILAAAVSVIAKAFSNILLALIGTTLFLLTVPLARSASTYAVAVLSAVAVGVIMSLFGIADSMNSALTHTFALFGGFFSFTILHVFGRLHSLVSDDDELADAIYRKLRAKILKDKGKK